MRAALVVLLAGCAGRGPVVTGGGSGGLVAYEETRISGYGSFPPGHISEPSVKAKVTDLTAEAQGEMTRWTLAVVDAANLGHQYAIELPAQVGFAVATGTTVTVDAEVVGGGPNARGHISVVDEQGGLVLAISRLPAGWTTEPGQHLRTAPGDSYDEKTFGVRVRAPGGAGVELVPGPWRKFELGGTPLVGNGNSSERELHGTAPPDYVGAWTDYTIVRAR
ncbi:MAG: hypothetical protein ABI678_19345 [Kofleriaceae bacterium]